MELTIQVVEGKIKLCSVDGMILELSKDQLVSLDRDIYAAYQELEEITE